MKKKLSGFELGRRQSVNKLREMMRYSYDKFTGKIVNQNGDVAKSMDEAIRLNEKLDRDLPQEKVFEPILDRLTNKKLDPWQVDTWETMKKVAKDEARKNGNYGELRELRKIERKSFNKRRPKKTEQTTNFVKFTNDIKPIPLPQITPEPEPVKVQEPKLKIYKDGGLGTMDRPTQVTIDAYRDLKWFNK